MRMLLPAVLFVYAAIAATSVGAKPVNVHYGLWTKEGEAQHTGALTFKAMIEAAAPDRFKVILHPNNQLGTPAEMQAQLALNALQIMASGDPGLNDIEYLSLPYLMRGMENYEYVLDGPIGEAWNAKLAANRRIRLLGLLPRSARQISANTVIQNMDDLKGLKIRVPGRDYYVQSMLAFGARPTPMDFAEVYMALQTGVVDGLENPVETLYAQRYYEVQKSIAMVDYIMKPAYVMIGEPFWQSLTENEKLLFKRAAVAARDKVVEILPQQERAFLAAMETQGITVTYPDKTEFIAATQQLRDELGIQLWGEALYRNIVEIGRCEF